MMAEDPYERAGVDDWGGQTCKVTRNFTGPEIGEAKVTSVDGGRVELSVTLEKSVDRTDFFRSRLQDFSCSHTVNEQRTLRVESIWICLHRGAEGHEDCDFFERSSSELLTLPRHLTAPQLRLIVEPTPPRAESIEPGSTQLSEWSVFDGDFRVTRVHLRSSMRSTVEGVIRTLSKYGPETLIGWVMPPYMQRRGAEKVVGDTAVAISPRFKFTDYGQVMASVSLLGHVPIERLQHSARMFSCEIVDGYIVAETTESLMKAAIGVFAYASGWSSRRI